MRIAHLGNGNNAFLSAFTIFTALSGHVLGFAPTSWTSTITSSRSHSRNSLPPPSLRHVVGFSEKSAAIVNDDDPTRATAITSRTTLSMSSNGEGGGNGKGIIGSLFIIAVLFYFAASAIGPLFDSLTQKPTKGDINIGDSVVTRSSSSSDGKVSGNGNGKSGGSAGVDRLKNYESKFDALSRSKIQDKLNRVPVFYTDSDGKMGENIYLSFNDASREATGGGASGLVRCTTLDQVMFPLVLARGRMRMAPPPTAVKNAEALINAANDGSNTSDDSNSNASSSPAPKFRLVPSTAATRQAKENFAGTSLDPNDVPLYVVDRLAFAGSSPGDGPQVPLFLERDDAMTSYARLREAGGNRLPEEPTVRLTTLLDVLGSMEKGSRPAVSQLQFYATQDDLLRASQLLLE